MDKIKFGFIGAGKIAGRSAASVQSHQKGQVAAVHDTNRGRMDELCREFSIGKGYGTTAEIFGDPEVDVVYIAVPNKFHAELAICALRAGKHVMLEKPFAMNASEAAEVVAEAERAKRVVTLGMNLRYPMATQQMCSLARSGALGEIYHAKAYWFRRQGIPKLGTWFGNRALAGGGAINDIGVHALDLCLHLMGDFEADTVSGVSYAKFGNRGLGEGTWGHSDRSDIVFDVDDFSSAFIRMKSGSSVTLDAVWACHLPERDHFNIELYGTEGSLFLNPLRYCYTSDGGRERIVEESLTGAVAHPHCDRFHNLINHLCEGEELLVKTTEALAVQRILDAVNRSARLGQEVNIFK